MIVIADASPLHYLILIGQTDILPRLYESVIIPAQVELELTHAQTPLQVRLWMEQQPSWLKVGHPKSAPSSQLLDLDAGERDALQLAIELSPDIVLMDDQQGRRAAAGLSIRIQGTLGIIESAAREHLLKLTPTLAALRQTNFRASSGVWHNFERLAAEFDVG